MPIDRKIDLYGPDWLFRWESEPLNPPPSNRKMVLVGTYPAYDDPVRREFLLYRLEPK